MMLPFPNQGRIALVVRGKTSRNTAPADNGHADVILPSGAPAEFFVHPRIEAGYLVGMDVAGCVYGYFAYSAYRPWYVNLSDARANNDISGVLLIRMTPRESASFLDAWLVMRARPGNFIITGFNCASHAALAFAMAGLVSREIPGLDTPDNLFHTLRSRQSHRCRDEYGYLGFLPRESSPDEMSPLCEAGIDGTLAAVSYSGPPPPRRGTCAGDGYRHGA